MDKVYINGLRVDAVIGVFEWEQKIRQPLIFDLEMGFDCRAAAKDDDISLALDYAKVSEYITQTVQASTYKLLETLGEVLARELLTRFHMSWLRLKIGKPNAVLNAAEVGIIIERGVER